VQSALSVAKSEAAQQVAKLKAQLSEAHKELALNRQMLQMKHTDAHTHMKQLDQVWLVITLSNLQDYK
jgi:hypothetical protein